MIQNKAKELIKQAVAIGVYDIYLTVHSAVYRIYFRDNQARFLHEELSEAEGQALLAHFKFLAGMNTGERRRSQLGSCWYGLDDEMDRRLRLSTVGDFEGRETLVIRILHESSQELKFWFEDRAFLESLSCGRGLYLFAGPVGSGKTSLMMDLARRYFSKKQVMTIEDPVELVESDFVQLQVNEVIGNGYDELIKLSLRHRPDLLIVGEIRDEQTARAVLRASLTGYTVFSTVHARSVSGVWSRLLELSLSEWELKNSLRAVIYQRLIRGKGLVDVAKNRFDSWKAVEWNKKIDRLFADGHLTVSEVEAEKIELGETSQVDSADGQFIG